MNFTHDIEVKPSEIRAAWATIMEGSNPFSDRQNASCLVQMNLDQYRTATAADCSWIGATGAIIGDRLDHGYSVESKDVKVAGGSEVFVMPQMELDDETGDLLIDQVLGGEDFYRVCWQESEAPKSLTIRICIGMHAGVLAEVLGAYMTWCLKVIDAAQRTGVTPTVELWVGTRNGFQRSQDSLRVRIPLVKSGEMMDVDSWRAFLTPGAFRSLGFVAIGLAADRTKAPRRLTVGMGQPTNKNWGVELNGSVLEIECPGGAAEFPEGLMDRMLEEAQTGA